MLGHKMAVDLSTIWSFYLQAMVISPFCSCHNTKLRNMILQLKRNAGKKCRLPSSGRVERTVSIIYIWFWTGQCNSCIYCCLSWKVASAACKQTSHICCRNFRRQHEWFMFVDKKQGNRTWSRCIRYLFAPHGTEQGYRFWQRARWPLLVLGTPQQLLKAAASFTGNKG